MKVKSENISPSFYLNDFFDLYQEGYTITALAETIYQNWKSHRIREGINESFFLDIRKISPLLCYRLIHYEKNKEMLKKHPHIPFLDLALVFYYRLPKEVLEGANVMVRAADIERWGIKKEELCRIVKENTPKQMPYRLTSMKEFLQEAGGQEQEDASMYILTNRDQFYGAAAILYPGLLEQISGHFRTNLYILPSSIHETILIPDRGEYSRADLENMVREVNKTQLKEEEILSDRVYYYDWRSKKLENSALPF